MHDHTSDTQVREVTHHVICNQCEQQHEAEYHHEGSFGEGPIFIVICERDGLADYYTTEGLDCWRTL